MAGAVIRAVGHPARPGRRHPLPAAALAPGRHRHDRHRQDHAAVAAVGRVHGHRAAAARGRARARRRCWWCWTARAARTRAGSPTGPGGCCARRAPGPPRSGRTRPACRCGRCRPRQLITTLVDLIEHGTGAAAYYADVMEAVVALAVEAPGGPPVSAADFLARLDPGWLAGAYSAGGVLDGGTRPSWPDPLGVPAGRRRRAAVPHPVPAAGRRPGRARAASPTRTPGTASWRAPPRSRVAEAQARALVDLLASYVTAARAGGGQAREILLAVDEFSAVSRRLPIWQLYERARSLGLAVQVSAQSWHGLAADDDERYRIAACRRRRHLAAAHAASRAGHRRWPGRARWWTRPGGCSAYRSGVIRASRGCGRRRWSTRP